MVAALARHFVLGAVLAVGLVLSGGAAAPAGDWIDRDAGSLAAIGGPFSHTDHQGRPVSDRDFGDRYMLVSFGYTYCPDLCPLGLQVMSDALEALGADGGRVVPLFITIDPERDTAPMLADYVVAFHARLVGLTGSRRQVAAAARAYAVRYGKLYLPDEESEYVMYHSTDTFLVGPDGRGRAIFRRGIAADVMAAEIRRRLAGGT